MFVNRIGMLESTSLVGCFGEYLQHHHKKPERLIFLDVFIAQIYDDQTTRANQILKMLAIIDVFTCK